jgi:transposase
MKNGEAYPVELRERVMRARRENGWSFEKTASFFHIGEATVNRWARLERETGALGARSRGPGHSPLLGAEDLTALSGLVKEKPDRTIPELVAEFFGRHGKRVSTSTMGRALQKLGLPLKKKSYGPRRSTARTSRRARQSSQSR